MHEITHPAQATVVATCPVGRLKGPKTDLGPGPDAQMLQDRMSVLFVHHLTEGARPGGLLEEERRQG